MQIEEIQNEEVSLGCITGKLALTKTLIMYSSKLFDTQSVFRYNLATSGGAIYSETSMITLDGTTFYKNYANDSGALHLTSESVGENLSNLTFSENNAFNNGGALSVLSSSKITISGSTFTKNLAGEASVIYALGTSGINNITDCIFSENESIHAYPLSFAFADLYMNGCKFTNNIVYFETAGIFLTFSFAQIYHTSFDNSRFENNLPGLWNETLSTSITWGFIYVNVDCLLILEYSTFQYGYATQGGAVYSSGVSYLYFSHNTFSDCFVINNGGMIYLNNYGIAVLSNNTFTNMRASGDGYGIYSTSGRLEIHQCTFLVSTLVNGQTIAS